MTTLAFAGVAYTSPQGGIACLPMHEVKVRALIVDGEWRQNLMQVEADVCLVHIHAVSARIDVIQAFSNPSGQSTPRAKYVFPVPARAAVCAFDMSTSSGKAIVGISKHKTRAKSEFEVAVQAGKTAALVEWITDDSELLNFLYHYFSRHTQISNSLHDVHWICPRK